MSEEGMPRSVVRAISNAQSLIERKMGKFTDLLTKLQIVSDRLICIC